jgi:hypothetical protein
MRKLIALLTTFATACFLAAAASGATIGDLQNDGYRVGIANTNNGCTTYYVSGFGNSTYMNDCDPNFQATVDNWADPTLNYERQWQFDHPDQLEAANALVGACYAVNRTAPMTDSWSVIGGGTNVVVSGADLPGLAGSLPNLSTNGSCVAQVGVSQTSPTTEADGTVTAPGAVFQAALLAAQAAAAADPSTVNTQSVLVAAASVGYTESAGFLERAGIVPQPTS